MKRILLQIGGGELLDRLTILEIKERHARPGHSQQRVRRELERVIRARARAGLAGPELEPAVAELRSINRALWALKEQIRACEACSDFGAQFIALARALIKNSDRRAAVRRRIDERCGADSIDERGHGAESSGDAVLRMLTRA